MKYPQNRVMNIIDDVKVITSESTVSSLPLVCPNCNYLFTNVEDIITYRKLQCCTWCANNWAYINQENWKKGWRPSEEEVIHKKSQRIKPIFYAEIS